MLSSNELDINLFISFKNVETYTVTFENDKIKYANITYQDKSTLKISKEEKNNTTIEYYTIDNINYASWYKDNYHYIYSSNKKIGKELELIN